MSARSPRRSFARSLVVTLAAVPAMVPACTKSPSRPPHYNPPRPTYPEPTPADPTPTDSTAPAPGEPTTPAAPTTAPSASAAPSASGEPAQAKPAKPPDYPQHWIVTKNGATCLAQPRVECSTGTTTKVVSTCNPPAASAYTCPPSMGDGPVTVVRYAHSFECTIERPPMRCPEGARCNPPPPRRVECPK